MSIKTTKQVTVSTRKNILPMWERLEAINTAIDMGYTISGSDVVNNNGKVIAPNKETFSVKIYNGKYKTIYKVDMASYMRYRSLFEADETNIGYPLDGNHLNVSFSNISYIKTNTTISDAKRAELCITNEEQANIVKFFVLNNKIDDDGNMTDKYNNPIYPNTITSSTKYPTVYIAGRTVPIHRIQAYRLYGKDIFKTGVVVRHIDDNKLDYTAKNITIGSHKDNMEDKVRNSGYYERQGNAVEVFTSTKSIQKTAKRTKETLSFIYVALNDAGIDWRYINTDTGSISEKAIDDMRLMASNGFTSKDIMATYNVSASTVSLYCSTQFEDYKSNVKESIRQLLSTKLKQSAIARKFGVSNSYVTSIKKEFAL